MRRSVLDHAHPVDGGAAIGRHVHFVLGEREGLEQQLADVFFVVHDEDPRASTGRGGRSRRSGAAARAWPLGFEPDVDVPFAEPPLASDPNRRNLAGLDQAIDSTQVHLQVLEYLFGRQERIVDHEKEPADVTLSPTAGRTIVKAVPRGELAAVIAPPWSWTIP